RRRVAASRWGIAASRWRWIASPWRRRRVAASRRISIRRLIAHKHSSFINRELVTAATIKQQPLASTVSAEAAALQLKRLEEQRSNAEIEKKRDDVRERHDEDRRRQRR